MAVGRGGAMKNYEDSISNELANILRRLRRGLWAGVSTQPLRYLDSGKPDVLVEVGAYQHVMIENEVAQNPDKDARARLEQCRREDKKQVVSVIALKTPERFRRISPGRVGEALAGAEDLECAVWGDGGRWPESGFVPLSVRGLAELVDHASKPLSAIDDAANTLTQAIEYAGTIFHARRHAEVAAALHQEAGSQTWRMAASMVANALMFQDRLAGFTPNASTVRPIKSVSACVQKDSYNRNDFIDEWNHILDINYWPIFAIARNIMVVPGARDAAEILQSLGRAAGAILSMGASGASDFTGLVFQRLIVDRKFLATFYTLPASAELLAGLAIDSKDNFLMRRENNGAVPDYSLADFACGTGGLLVAAAHRVSNIYAEKHAVDRDGLHKIMMERMVFGADVFPSAVHLTASLLSSMRPEVTYLDSRIYEMPYGKSPDWIETDSKTGSLELVAHERPLSLSTKQLAGKKAGESRTAAHAHAPNGSFQLVIMNPPFTRATNHEGAHSTVPNPAFAGLGNTLAEQKQMSRETARILAGKKDKTGGVGAYHGNAGLATAFLDLADLKLAADGVLAFVLPLTFASGSSWENARTMMRKRYTDIRIVTIAAPKSHERSFSADTGMAECLLIARRGTPQGDGQRATSIVLTRRPQTPMEGAVFAELIKKAMAEGPPMVEDAPAGTKIGRFGGEIIAHITEVRLPESGPWGFAGASDFETVQTAYQLAKRGKLWLSDESRRNVYEVPVATIGAFAHAGPVDRDINGINPDKTARGPFDIIPIYPGKVPTIPCLWAHNHTKETCLEVKPDTEAMLRHKKLSAKADKIRATSSRIHWNRNFQFNAQSTNVVMTDRKTLGGSAWPSVIFKNEAHEKAFAIWHNTTPGLLLRWWYSNRQQAGRGNMTVTTIPAMPSLDVRQLSKAQLKTADKIYDEMKDRPMLSFYRLHKDRVRHELDRRVLADILGLPESVCAEGGPLQLLREKLAAEPSINGGKSG